MKNIHLILFIQSMMITFPRPAVQLNISIPNGKFRQLGSIEPIAYSGLRRHGVEGKLPFILQHKTARASFLGMVHILQIRIVKAFSLGLIWTIS